MALTAAQQAEVDKAKEALVGIQNHYKNFLSMQNTGQVHVYNLASEGLAALEKAEDA